MTSLYLRTSAFLAAAIVLFAKPVRAELDLSVFTGVALTQDNDLTLHQRGGTDLTFHDVSYEGRDFETPPYYGARLLWFAAFGAEFFHVKLYADTGDIVHVTGWRDGARVDANERIDDTIESFSISHGLNFPLADLVYRWLPGERWQPYVGIGLGAVIPHVESSVGGTFHEEYQFHGPGAEALAGVNFDLTRHWGVMFEYKFTYANLDSLDIPVGSIEITPLTHQLVAGITFRF